MCQEAPESPVVHAYLHTYLLPADVPCRVGLVVLPCAAKEARQAPVVVPTMLKTVYTCGVVYASDTVWWPKLMTLETTKREGTKEVKEGPRDKKATHRSFPWHSYSNCRRSPPSPTCAVDHPWPGPLFITWFLLLLLTLLPIPRLFPPSSRSSIVPRIVPGFYSFCVSCPTCRLPLGAGHDSLT